MAKRTALMYHLWPLAVALAATACLRYAALAVNPVAEFVVNALIAYAIALGMQRGSIRTALLYAVVIALFAWLIDVMDGTEAIAYGVGYAAMGLMWLKTPRVNGILRAVLAALAAAAGIALAAAVTLFVAREMTLGAALMLSVTRQQWPVIAFCLGGLLRALKR